MTHSSGLPDVDKVLQGLIGIFETSFPGRIRAYYLVGSRADGSAVARSDLDFRAIFKGSFEEGEEERARLMRRYCGMICSMDLDMPMLSEELLARTDLPERYGYAYTEAIAIKSSSILLYGEDIRDRIVPAPIDVYTRDVVRVPLIFAVQQARQREWVTFPLTYPDPAGEFYGYDRGDDTQLLVLIAGWVATAIVAIRAGQYVARKSDWVATYRTAIGDEWTAFQEDVYKKCKQRWGYQIPHDAAERDQLRDLCRRMLAFENHYLAILQAYLLAQLQQEDQHARLAAVRRLGEVIYPDRQIQDALRTLQGSPNDNLRRLAQTARERMR